MRALCLIGALAVAAHASGPSVRVRQASGEIADLPLERYVAQVVAGEGSVLQSPEALKAMAVAARTWAIRMRGRHAAEGYDFCATTHCQRLESAPAAPRIARAVADTAGELLWYQGKPAFTPYTRACGGRSEDAGALWPDTAEPYLKVHDDPYCVRTGASAWQWSGDPRAMAEALARASLRAPAAVERIAVAARDPSGRAQTLLLSGGGESVRISAGSFRFAIGRAIGWNTVRSDFYQVHSSGGRVVFDGRGSGHGAGLCQVGADAMGSEGHSYREILAFYYPGTQVGANARDIPWQRLDSGDIALLTINPSQDGPVLALAERALHDAAAHTHWPTPRRLEIYLYPDIDRFRDATGEPGWVAAHTVGARIHLQPAATLRGRGILESTIRHEMLHVLLESQARTGLPLWFREGLVEYLANGPAPGPARIPAERDLRQTADAARARQAYQEAARTVSELARRYGETAVLEWVKRGVPEEVTKP